ncbi:hypothetical protein J3R30DRAFT_3696547 [Lentinula aciculospora]|uniref:Uncharacterized protein n=1 Tax=Lentinula aciculospora TaxID=153920 RepID=A0A9W9ANA8_9AGAR|nr:hypothetical protein J3R30DRAFT_3696547 [Lentinula aciculospora]
MHNPYKGRQQTFSTQGPRVETIACLFERPFVKPQTAFAMFSLIQVLSLILAMATTSLASPGPYLRRSPTATVVQARDFTNAERFSRGLPPLAPRVLYNPTRVRRSLPSSSPTIVSNVGVFNKATGASVGYVRGATVTTAESSSTTFAFRSPSSASDLVELNDNSSGLHYVLASYTNGYYVGPGTYNSLILTTTTLSTPAGSGQQPDYTKGPIQYSESPIWSIDPSTGVVTAYWVNSNGSQYQVYFLSYVTTVGTSSTTSLIFTGDVAAYKVQFPTRIFTEVTLVVSV